MKWLQRVFFFLVAAAVLMAPQTSQVNTYVNGNVLTADQLNAEFGNLYSTINSLDEDNFLDTTSFSATFLNAAAAGDGIARDTGTGVLEVNVDDSTLEVSSDVVRVKDSGITSAKILNGTIATADIADSQVTSAKVAADTLTSDDIATDAIGAAEIVAGAVGTSEISDGTVSSTDIANGTITGDDVSTSATLSVTSVQTESGGALKWKIITVGTTSDTSGNVSTAHGLTLSSIITVLVGMYDATNSQVIGPSIYGTSTAPATHRVNVQATATDIFVSFNGAPAVSKVYKAIVYYQ